MQIAILQNLVKFYSYRKRSGSLFCLITNNIRTYQIVHPGTLEFDRFHLRLRDQLHAQVANQNNRLRCILQHSG